MFCDVRCRRKQRRAAQAAARRAGRWSNEYRSQSIKKLSKHDARVANAIAKSLARFKRGDLGDSKHKGIGVYDVGACRVELRIEAGPIMIQDTYDMPIEFF